MLPEEIRQQRAEIVLEEVQKIIASGSIKKDLTVKGAFRKSAPKNPLSKFVWRMVRFYSNIDPSIPTTTEFYLQDFVDDFLNQPKVHNLIHNDNYLTVYRTTGKIKSIYEALDNEAERLCVVFGLNPNNVLNSYRNIF